MKIETWIVSAPLAPNSGAVTPKEPVLEGSVGSHTVGPLGGALWRADEAHSQRSRSVTALAKAPEFFEWHAFDLSHAAASRD